MDIRILALSLCSLGLLAQTSAAPAIKVVIQNESQSKDSPPIDAAPITKAFGEFSHAAGFTGLPQDGDGWVLGVQVSSLLVPGRLAIAKATLRLARVEKGQMVKKDVRDCSVLGEARTSEALSVAMAYSLTRRAYDLLREMKVITLGSGTETDPHDPDWVPGVVTSARFFRFSSIEIDRMPATTLYQSDPSNHGVEGTVLVDVNASPEGNPTAVVARSGPSLLLQHAIEWALKLHFKPLMFEGSPVEGRLHMRLNYKVGLPAPL